MGSQENPPSFPQANHQLSPVSCSLCFHSWSSLPHRLSSRPLAPLGATDPPVGRVMFWNDSSQKPRQ